MKRREFLGAMGLGAAGAMAAMHPAVARAYPANETINVGLIGTGGRCRGELLPELKKIPGVRITAVCDVWDVHRDLAKKEADPDALSTRSPACAFRT